jgi:hypothetical protein
MNKPKLVIADMYRAKNKEAFFAIHQAINKLSEFELEFHIIWDNAEPVDKWTDLIENLDCNIVPYSKQMLDDYCRSMGVDENRIKSFSNFNSIYFILHGHYLKNNNITDYYLIYDDDIILQGDLQELTDCLKNKVPCLITEPLNAGCDKSMAAALLNLYEGSFEYYKAINPTLAGFNAGFQGISLDMYEDFLEPEYFKFLLELFNYKGIYDDQGKEITGPERSAIDTQQQSFFGIMNIIRSHTTPHILTPSEYFVCPNWGVHPLYGDIVTSNEYQGWDVNMKSKVVHFIGHTVLDGVYYGKPKQYYKMVDEYLKQNKIE